MSQVDPTKIHVQSNAVPIWESEQTFQDMMAEQNFDVWVTDVEALNSVMRQIGKIRGVVSVERMRS